MFKYEFCLLAFSKGFTASTTKDSSSSAAAAASTSAVYNHYTTEL